MAWTKPWTKPSFRYDAVAADGSAVVGTVDAADADAAGINCAS